MIQYIQYVSRKCRIVYISKCTEGENIIKLRVPMISKSKKNLHMHCIWHLLKLLIVFAEPLHVTYIILPSWMWFGQHLAASGNSVFFLINNQSWLHKKTDKSFGKVVYKAKIRMWFYCCIDHRLHFRESNCLFITLFVNFFSNTSLGRHQVMFISLVEGMTNIGYIFLFLLFLFLL